MRFTSWIYLEDIAVRYAPTKDGYECYAKFKGEAEYKYPNTPMWWRGDMGGTIMTKAEYERY